METNVIQKIQFCYQKDGQLASYNREIKTAQERMEGEKKKEVFTIKEQFSHFKYEKNLGVT